MGQDNTYLLSLLNNSDNIDIAVGRKSSSKTMHVFGTLVTAYNYNKYLESITMRDKYHSYVRYIDIKGQFDVENNMPSQMVKVNARSDKLEKIGTNGVHPTMEGYLQIGDAFYRALVSDMEEEK